MMCGRFSLSASEEKLKKQFNIQFEGPYTPSYNIAPSQSAFVITDFEEKIAESKKWGLIPHWANNKRVGNHLINARKETIFTKPSFRLPIRKKRCLIPIDGFYEWKNRLGGKQPYRICLPDDEVFFLAGIYDDYVDEENQTISSFSIITTSVNKQLADIHDRMPVIIMNEEDQNNWLSNDLSLENIENFMLTLANDVLITYPVSPIVNKPQNNFVSLFDKYTPPRTLFDL